MDENNSAVEPTQLNDNSIEERENNTLAKRPSLLRCPDKNRKIKFKKNNSNIWKEGVVTKIFKLDNKRSKCLIKVEHEDEVELDFASGNFTWTYENFYCSKCDG